MIAVREIEAFIQNNTEEFQSILLSAAGNKNAEIKRILEAGNIDLLKNAEQIAFYVLGDRREELISFAEVEGIAWAKHSLTLAFKLEWIHAIRRTLWTLLSNHRLTNIDDSTVEQFYQLEKKINDGIDEFLNSFFISYSKYKDELLMTERKLVEHLTVPIMPVTSSVVVLPLIGEFDTYRMSIIEEKIFNEISRLKIELLFIDLSGMPDIDEFIISNFEKVLVGIKMMGSKAVLTGLRPKLAKRIAALGMQEMVHIETKATLQQALREYLIIDS
ncbi:STAS domain-containing protein [Oceanobacillus sp. CAU 1775]